MNDNAKKWVAALRSGKFKQGKGSLGDCGLYCCLGVACELAIENGVNINVKDEGGRKSYDGAWATVPESVEKWLGLNEDTGGYEGEDGYETLTEQNDGGMSFQEIADIIESEPEGLFIQSQPQNPTPTNSR